jgi:16S rRNA (uracil1498-N3)-methyltransferase
VHARFFAPAAAAPGDSVELPRDEARHLTRVLRLSAGDAIRVFNGRGSEFEALVERAGKDGVRVRVGGPCAPAGEAAVRVTLAQAVLKGERMDDVVRDAVMMGVAAIQPVLTARTEVSLSALERGRRCDRWERIAVSSAKQCGRAVVPPILAPLPLAAVLEALDRGVLPGPAILLAEPSVQPQERAGQWPAAPPAQATILIGPEGGWTDAEVGAARTRCLIVSLGGRTLRADAMPIVALASLFTRWGEL